MNAQQKLTRPRQSGDTTVVVVPSSNRYLEQMAACHQAGYGYTPDDIGPEDMTVEKYQQHLQIFPEGQFIALEVETDTVVGVTTSMRTHFDPYKPHLDSWLDRTAGG